MLEFKGYMNLIVKTPNTIRLPLLAGVALVSAIAAEFAYGSAGLCSLQIAAIGVVAAVCLAVPVVYYVNYWRNRNRLLSVRYWFFVREWFHIALIDSANTKERIHALQAAAERFHYPPAVKGWAQSLSSARPVRMLEGRQWVMSLFTPVRLMKRPKLGKLDDPATD